MFVHAQYDLWCSECKNLIPSICSLHGHSSMTLICLYMHNMTWCTEYMHKMTWCTECKNSSPQFVISMGTVPWPSYVCTCSIWPLRCQVQKSHPLNLQSPWAQFFDLHIFVHNMTFDVPRSRSSLYCQREVIEYCLLCDTLLTDIEWALSPYWPFQNL